MCIFAKITRLKKIPSPVHPNESLVTAKELDRINLISFLFAALGISILLLGIRFVHPNGAMGVLADSYEGWLGIVADALLLYWINHSIKREEEKKLIEQFGSESNAFALDAAKKLRKKSWLVNGKLNNRSFIHAQLQHANLSKAQLRNADLNHANLSHSLLVEADFNGSNLSGANLSHAECRWADFRNANLRWANLEGAALDGAKFDGADLRFAKLGKININATLLDHALIEEGLSDEEIALVQNSCKLIRKSMEEFSHSFYRELFKTNPMVKALFLSNIDNQAHKFAQFFELLVSSLNNPEKLLPALKSLGRRHINYGVQEYHYKIVGVALMNTLRKSLGTTFTPEVESAWLKMYDLVTMIMIDSSRGLV